MIVIIKNSIDIIYANFSTGNIKKACHARSVAGMTGFLRVFSACLLYIKLYFGGGACAGVS